MSLFTVIGLTPAAPKIQVGAEIMMKLLTGVVFVVVFSVGVIAEEKAAQGSDVVYKTIDGKGLKLFLTKPAEWKGSDSRPMIVFFHGGGWTGGPVRQFENQSKYFASRGLVCAEVEYRLAKGKEKPLVCIQDARSAMRWLRAHAKELGIDPERIAVGGGSAGGHLAACTGMIQGNDDPADDKSVPARPDAMLLFNPVFDNGPGGYGNERMGADYKKYSPVHNISADDPPAIVFLGSADKLIPVKTVENFKAEMVKAGVKCEAYVYAGQVHGFFNKDPYLTETLIESDKFLVSLGWLKGPPALTSKLASE